MDIAVIIPHLAVMGGAIRVAIENIKRWQHHHQVTIYTGPLDEKLLSENQVDKVRIKRISPFEEYKDQWAIFLNHMVIPHLWKTEIGEHDVYVYHFFPSNLVNKRPAVWYPHEPFRIVNDMRYELKPEPYLFSPGTLASAPDNDHFNHQNILLTPFDLFADSVQEILPHHKFDRVVANSTFCKKMLEETYGLEVHDIVYPGFPELHPPSEPSAENIILSVSNLEVHKRVDLLIQAMRFVPKGKLYLIGFANEAHQEELKYLCRLWGVEQRVVYLGMISDQEMEDYIRQSLCFAFVPFNEPFGIVPFEAMAHAKPLVAVREGGYTDLISDDMALLVNPYPQEIGQAINRLIEDKKFAAELGKRGQEGIRPFTWDKMADDLLEVCQKAMLSYQEEKKQENLLLPSSSPSSSSSWSPLVGVEYAILPKSRSMEAYQYSLEDEMNIPHLGFYDSGRGYVLREHFRMLKKANLDFLMINFSLSDLSSDHYELQVLDRLVRILEKDSWDLQFFINLKSSGDQNQDQKYFFQYIQLIEKCFAKRKNYLRIQGKSLINIDGTIDLVDFEQGGGNSWSHLLLNFRRKSSSAEDSWDQGDGDQGDGDQGDGDQGDGDQGDGDQGDGDQGDEIKIENLENGLSLAYLRHGLRKDGLKKEEMMLSYQKTLTNHLTQNSSFLTIIQSFNNYQNGLSLEAGSFFGDNLLTLTKESLQVIKNGPTA